MTDLIEIALTRLTDFTRFEQMACDVLRAEGYPRIEPLGGTHDQGRDAVNESHFSDGVQRTVFQITLEKYLPAKISRTVKRLREAGVQFTELVIATPHHIGTELSDNLKEVARRDYNVTLDIFPRARLVNRLADLSNGVFHRYFPDPVAQANAIVASKPTFAEPAMKALEIAMLKNALAFSFNPRASSTRKSLFDALVMSLISASDTASLDLAALKAGLQSTLKRAIEDGQVSATLQRLEESGSVKISGSSIVLTPEARARVEASTIRANAGASDLIDGVVEAVCKASPSPVSAEDRRAVARNTQDVLIDFFRLHGMEAAGDPLNVLANRGEIGEQQLLVEQAARGLPAYLAPALVAVLGDVISNPTSEQAGALLDWHRAFVAIQVMNIDPALRELQAGRITRKVFLLDTDYVLDCLVQEHMPADAYIRLVGALAELGCPVYTPPQCIDECVNHARFAPKTYGYFGRSLLSLSPDIVDSEVNNVFVKGFYYGVVKGKLPADMPFEKYVANYYERNDARDFMVECLKDALPKGIHVDRVPASTPVNETAAITLKLTDILYDLARSSRKGLRRTDGENRQLAKTDAELYTCAYLLNKPGTNSQSRILPGACYLVTASTRYSYGCMKLGIAERVTTSPQALLGLMDAVGHTTMSPTEMVGLYHNPLLLYAAQQAWPDAERLARSGISLRGVSLPRLRRAFDDGIHDMLTKVGTSEDAVESDAQVEVSPRDIETFLALLDKASAQGFGMIPELGAFRQVLLDAKLTAGKTEEDRAVLARKLALIEERIGVFGKRRQRYLRRLLRAQSSSGPASKK